MSDNRFFKVSWGEFHRDARALAWRLGTQTKWQGIIAVTRGGLVPAAIVARELDIRLIDTVCISSYDEGDHQTEPEILKSIERSGEGWIVIDDLVDSGKTFKIIREMMPKAHFAAIYAKPLGQGTADTYVTEVSQDTWIVFPWEE